MNEWLYLHTQVRISQTLGKIRTFEFETPRCMLRGKEEEKKDSR